MPVLIELFRPQSVVDVGFGTGLWLAAFRRQLGELVRRAGRIALYSSVPCAGYSHARTRRRSDDGAFAIAGTRHVSIAPDHAEADCIRAYCARHGIRDTITFIDQSSDTALPAGVGIPDRLDFVLIDGAHRFPFPIIDWH